MSRAQSTRSMTSPKLFPIGWPPLFRICPHNISAWHTFRVNKYNNMSTAQQKQEKYQKKDSSFGASCTSFYTTEEKKDSYETLEDVLLEKCADEKVRAVIQDLMQICADITEALRVALVTVEGSTNDFGDSQLSVDVRPDVVLSVCDMVAEMC